LCLFLGVNVTVISAESQSASTVTSQSFSTSVVSDASQSSAASANRELAPPKLVLTAADKTLTVGQTVQIQANPKSAGIVWRSSEPKVATVDAESGRVTARRAGDVTISGTLTKDQVTTTAAIKLTVVPVVKRARQSVAATVDPADFKITTELKNHTYDIGDTATHLKSVTGRDTFQIFGVLTVPELPQNNYQAALSIEVASTTTVNEVLVDGEAIEYAVLGHSDPRLKTVKIFNIEMASQAKHTFSVLSEMDSVSSPWTYNGQVSAAITENHEEQLGTALGNLYTIDYIIPQIVAEANTVDFGVIKTSAVGILFDGQSNGALLKVTDTRREKDGAQVYLSQDAVFTSPNGSLDADLYFETTQGLALLSNMETLIQETEAGEPLQSVTGQPLKFKLNGNSIKPGYYQTTLSWTIVAAPS